MKTLRNTVLAIGTLAVTGFLGGCTAFTSFSEVEALNEAQAVGSPFTQALSAEYRNYANSELKDMFDYPDALHFARKGLAAAAGETVLPEPVADWNLSEDHISELGAARGRLIVAYDLAARETSPDLAARAQSRFDCWIEQQEENWNSNDLLCKSQFMDIMDQLEAGLQPPPMQEPIMDEAIPLSPFDINASEPMEAEDAVYLVFFNWDSNKLGSGALNVLDAVAEEVRKNPPTAINVIGHADTSGAKKYNERLAYKRANVVRDALIERGIDPALLVVDARGEAELLVATPDNVREPANRRVNISFN